MIQTQGKKTGESSQLPVEFAEGEEVVFGDRSIQDRGSICGKCLLVRLQQVLKFLQFFPLDHPIQVHLFQDHVTW